jgi:hypothetical protein
VGRAVLSSEALERARLLAFGYQRGRTLALVGERIDSQ